MMALSPSSDIYAELSLNLLRLPIQTTVVISQILQRKGWKVKEFKAEHQNDLPPLQVSRA